MAQPGDLLLLVSCFCWITVKKLRMSRIYYLQNRSSLGGFRQNYDRCYSDLDNTFILHPCRQYCLPKFIVNWFWCSCVIKFGNSALSDKLPMWAPSITTSSYSKAGFLFFSPWMSPSTQNVSFYPEVLMGISFSLSAHMYAIHLACRHAVAIWSDISMLKQVYMHCWC